jgi:hypothetical protein
MPKAMTTNMSIQPEDTLNRMIPLSIAEPSMVAHVGITLDPK